MTTPPLTEADLARLAALHDIFEPPGIGLWPPAPGWLLVGLLALLIGLRAAQALYRRWRRNRYRRVAMRKLRRLNAIFDTRPPQQTLTEVLVVLRECALAAAQTGETGRAIPGGRTDWHWILRAPPSVNSLAVPSHLIEEAAYWPAARVTAEDARTVLRFACQWIRLHRSAA